MFAGALVGALLLKHVDAALPLVVAAVMTAFTAVVLGTGPGARALAVQGSAS
jgi:hypothetical protein